MKKFCLSVILALAMTMESGRLFTDTKNRNQRKLATRCRRVHRHFDGHAGTGQRAD